MECTKISFCLLQDRFFFFLSPCYMKYYFLQEYGRLLSIYVTLHFWTLFSGSRNIANNFGPYSEISVRVGSVNQHYFTSPNWYKMESLQFHVTYWLNYCTTVQLCVWSGGAKDARTPSPNFSFSCSFWQTICKIIGWHSPLGFGFPLPLENPGSATGMIKKCAHIL